MAKLLLYTEMQFNGVDSIPSTGVAAAIAPKKIISIDNTTSGASRSMISYKRLDNSNPDNIIASGGVTSLATAMNAANTTDVQKLALPIIDQVTKVTATKQIIVDDIHQVKVDKASSAWSYIWVKNATETQLTALHASTTVAAIVTAANA